jgi:hypothetical protein
MVQWQDYNTLMNTGFLFASLVRVFLINKPEYIKKKYIANIVQPSKVKSTNLRSNSTLVLLSSSAVALSLT